MRDNDLKNLFGWLGLAAAPSLASDGMEQRFSSISSGSFLRVPEHGINLTEDEWFIILELPLRFPFL